MILVNEKHQRAVADEELDRAAWMNGILRQLLSLFSAKRLRPDPAMNRANDRVVVLTRGKMRF